MPSIPNPDALERARMALDENAQGISWGLSDLDAAIGPAHPGRMVVIGARPSNGKTTLLFNWLNSIYAKIISAPRTVLAFWTERAPEVAYRTWVALRLGLDEDAVLRNAWDELPREAREAIETELLLLGYEDERIYFSELAHPTLRQLLETVTTTERRMGKLDVVIFDFLQKIRPEGRQTRFEAWAEAATTLQELAVKRELVVVAGSQLRRQDDQVFDKYRPPHLSGYKGASEIEENADVALGLFRPLRRMTAKEERAVRNGELDLEAFKEHDVMAIKVLKHRYRGPAADRIVKVRCEHGWVLDYEQQGVDGYGWEEINREHRFM